jgi:hypothetical protein
MDEAGTVSGVPSVSEESRLKGACSQDWLPHRGGIQGVDRRIFAACKQTKAQPVFIPLNGAPRHRDSQDWLPHSARPTTKVGLPV